MRDKVAHSQRNLGRNKLPTTVIKIPDILGAYVLLRTVKDTYPAIM